MKVLAIARPNPADDVRSAIARHAGHELRALSRLYREGIVREAYSPAGPGAVLILEAPGARDAAATLGGLPLIAEQIMRLEVIELRPFGAWQALFAKETSA